MSHLMFNATISIFSNICQTGRTLLNHNVLHSLKTQTHTILNILLYIVSLMSAYSTSPRIGPGLPKLVRAQKSSRFTGPRFTASYFAHLILKGQPSSTIKAKKCYIHVIMCNIVIPLWCHHTFFWLEHQFFHFVSKI